jgi:hypothetical protein
MQFCVTRIERVGSAVAPMFLTAQSKQQKWTTHFCYAAKFTRLGGFQLLRCASSVICYTNVCCSAFGLLWERRSI